MNIKDLNLSEIATTMLFKSMSEDEIKKCLMELKSNIKHYKKGEYIMLAGDSTDSIGLVLTGSVTIESNDIWGNKTILSHVAKNGFFAETYALIPNEIMLVDVTANEECSILFLCIASILNDTKPETWKDKLIKNTLRISMQKNLMLSKRSFHISKRNARARILSYLNTVALQKKTKEFDIPFNRQQLADYLNLERTNMSKELSKMQAEGLIEFRKNHFKLNSKIEENF